MISYPDPEELWKVTKARLDAMTNEERRQTLEDAGILTPDFKPAKHYRHMFAEGSLSNGVGEWKGARKALDFLSVGI